MTTALKNKDGTYQLSVTVDLYQARYVLSDYFNTVVPDVFILAILSKHPKLLGEALNGTMTDTCVRDMLIDRVCRELGLGDWPTIGEGQDLTDKFLVRYKEAITRVGGSYIDDENRAG